MKILHINTHDRGGAANAAIRLHKALLEQGIDSNMLFLKNMGATVDKSSYFSTPQKTSSFKQHLKLKLGFSAPHSLENELKEQLNQLPTGYEGYSLPVTRFRLEDSPEVKEAGIIHLHWVSRFLDYSFFERLDKPVVWTLHDMNPFLGGFHYQLDADAFSTSFKEMEQQLLAYKQSALARSEQVITVVAPSSYLLSTSKNSYLFQRYSHDAIRYSLNLKVFKPYDQRAAREIWDLPQDKCVILFVSEDIQNKRKGFDLLLKATEQVESEQVIFCAIGKTQQELPKHVRHLGSFRDEMLLALAYSAADAFVLPSREDNLPNTMLEALACGTPVIAFNRGGMADIIKTGNNGVLLSEVQAEVLAEAINDLLAAKYSFDRQQIRAFAEHKFSPEKQAKEYLKVYETIINNDAHTRTTSPSS